MRKLSEKQAALLATIRVNPGLNTHQLAVLMGDRQSYEKTLTDRLFRLVDYGFLAYKNNISERGNVKSRQWFPADSPVQF